MTPEQAALDAAQNCLSGTEARTFEVRGFQVDVVVRRVPVDDARRIMGHAYRLALRVDREAARLAKLAYTDKDLDALLDEVALPVIHVLYSGPWRDYNLGVEPSVTQGRHRLSLFHATTAGTAGRNAA